MYFAMIGDIIQSKKVKNRNEIQTKLKMILTEMNQDYEEEVAANFVITLGDEFQGLLSSSKNILHIVDRIQFELYPIRIRFGIGIGDIDTEINKDLAIGADGPAYHYARKMIDLIKQGENGKKIGSANVMIYAEDNNNVVSLINSNLQLCAFLERKWTEKQRLLMEKIILKDQNQIEAAKELEIAQSSVQRRLKAAGYYDYIDAKTIINTVISKTWGEIYE